MKNLLNRNENPTILAFFLLIVTFFTAYHASVSAMLSHGITWHILIPPMALVLAWKQTVFPVVGKNSIIEYSIGTLLVLFAFFVVFTGDVTSTQALSELGIVVGLWGTVLFTGGYRLLIALLWPMLYLFFISSLTEGAFDIFTDFFRNASAKLSFTIANMIGFSIMHSGTYLRLPTMVLNVANECSGINHFISLAAIAVPLAVLTQRKTWALIFIVLSSFPIALFSNSIRVLFIILYNYNRMEFSHGPKNILVTGVGFFIGLLMLYGLAMLLNWIFPNKGKKEKRITENFAHYAQSINKKPLYFLSGIFFCGFLILKLWTVKPVEQPALFTQLPSSLPYSYQIVPTLPGIDALPETDNHVALQFDANLSDHHYMMVGWYSKQEPGKEVYGYNWNKLFFRTGSHIFTLNNNTRIDFTICKTQSKENHYSYLITYRSRNRYTSDPLKIRLYLLLDALFHRSTSGTIIIIAIPETLHEGNMLKKFADEFLNVMYPVIESSIQRTTYDN
jgi:exosortase